MRKEGPRQYRKGQHKKRSRVGAFAQRSADPPPSDYLDIAVRAFSERADIGPSKRGPRRKVGQPSNWTLIFDTETTTDASQRLRFGSYEVRDGPELAERGIFYVPDDPAALSESDLRCIKKYSERHGLTLHTVRDFVDNIFYDVGYHFRASIVGFNLPFDISRLAIRHEAARAVSFASRDHPNAKTTNRNMVGGFSFELSQHPRPHVRVKHRSSKDAFFQFTSLVRGGRGRRGFFVDVKTIASAILGKSFSLENSRG